MSKPYKIFVSYAHKDLEENIAKTQYDWCQDIQILRETIELSVWCDKYLASGDEFDAKIQHSIKEAHAAILFVGKHFIHSDYIVTKEVPPILANEIPVIPVVIDVPAYTNTVYQYKDRGGNARSKNLKGFQSENYNTPFSDLSAIEQHEHILRIKYRLCELAEIDSKSQRLFFPRTKNEFFIGRRQQLFELWNALALTNKVAICRTSSVCGLGGIGKTQLALEYAYQYRVNYELVAFITADSITGLRINLQRLAHYLNIFGPDIDTELLQLQEWLQTTSDLLLIFDNVNLGTTFTAIKDFLPPEYSGHVLVTTRFDNCQAWGINQRIRVGEFSIAEATQFLEQRTKKPIDESTSKIAELLGCFPLALEQAAAYIFEHDISYAAYIAIFEERQLELIHAGSPYTSSIDNDFKTIATTWLINIQSIEAKHPDVAWLFRLCSFLAPATIPFEFALEAISSSGIWPNTSISCQAEVAAFLHSLRQYSLIQNSENGFIIHQLVQEVVRASISNSEAGEYIKIIIGVLKKVSPFPDQNNWTLYRIYIPHILYIFENYKLHLEEDAHWGFSQFGLLGCAANYLSEQHSFNQCEKIIDFIKNIQEKQLGLGHPNLAFTYNELAEVYRSQNKLPTQTEIYLQKALDLMKRDSQPYDLIATVLNNTGLYYEGINNFNKAENYFLEAINGIIKETSLGWNQKQKKLGLLYNNLAHLYCQKGDYKKAIDFNLKAKSIREEILDPDDLDLAFTYNNLAFAYEQISPEMFLEIEALYKKSYTIRFHLLKEQHPLTLETFNNLRVLYIRQGFSQEEVNDRLSLFLEEIAYNQ